MRKIALLALTVVLVFALFKNACAGEVDILVQKLVEKGILSPGEAQQILTETREEVKKELAKSESISVPKWVQNIKLKGDFRTRYQYEKRKGAPPATSTAERNRARIRLRVGAEAKVVDKLKVGFGLATGNDSDPRSTNQTLQDTFSKKPVWIDYAYAQYDPLSWLSLIGGKFKNPIWQTGDMLWDTDINPEGLAANLNYNVFDNLKLFFNGAFFILDESKDQSPDNSDPLMFAFQPGFEYKPTDKINLKGAVTYYQTENVKGSILDHRSSRGSNTLATRPASGLRYDYDSIAASAELGFSEPLGTSGVFAYLPYVGIFGDYIYNFDPPKGNNGWLAGFQIGHKKVSNRNQWMAKYMYRDIGRDAWLDTFPDSDFYAGATNVRGHEVILEYALLDNVVLAADYYHTRYDKATYPRAENLLQIDVNYKF